MLFFCVQTCVLCWSKGWGRENTEYVFEKELAVRKSQYDTLPHCIISLDMFVMLCHCVLTLAHNYTVYGTSIDYVMSPCHTTEGFCDFEIPIRDLKVDFTEVKNMTKLKRTKIYLSSSKLCATFLPGLFFL